MRKLANTLLALLSIVFAASCQQSVSDDVAEDVETGGNNVKISIAQIEQVPFNSPANIVRASDVKQVCSRILFAVYTSDGTKKMSEAQSSTDKDFGKFSTNLENGKYRIVVLAYNCKYNPTNLADPDKINFGNNRKMSDTFLWSEEVTVENSLEKNVTLKRAVAMFRLKTTDNIPSNVVKMKFHYTGGSSTINAITGKGCVKSQQDETFAVTETGKPGTFEVYTFPRDDSNVLNMTITALDANENPIATRVFEDVPITLNKVTQYEGAFFTGEGSGSGNITFNVTVEDEWDGTIQKEF